MPEVRFMQEMAKLQAPVVMELGTRRVAGQPTTVRKDWLTPHAGEYLKVDFQAGEDVDIVADVHSLSATLGENRCDGIIACSVFEHVQYPWIAALEICRVLKPGGLVFVQTHHAYPLHGYPSDYWRFTEAGLRSLFHPQIGYELVGTRSDFPCYIVSEREPHLVLHPSHLNVIITARKVGHPAVGHSWRV